MGSSATCVWKERIEDTVKLDKVFLFAQKRLLSANNCNFWTVQNKFWQTLKDAITLKKIFVSTKIKIRNDNIVNIGKQYVNLKFVLTCNIEAGLTSSQSL